MTYLNKQQRDKLQEDLKKLNFNQAKGKLRRMDPKGRLVYYRNVQAVNQWATRFELSGLGVRVTLIETQEYKDQDSSAQKKADYDLVDIMVEPTAENKA